MSSFVRPVGGPYEGGSYLVHCSGLYKAHTDLSSGVLSHLRPGISARGPLERTTPRHRSTVRRCTAVLYRAAGLTDSGARPPSLPTKVAWVEYHVIFGASSG